MSRDFKVIGRASDEPPETPVDENTTFRTKLGFAAAIIGSVVVGTLGWSALNQKVEIAEKERAEMKAAHVGTDSRVVALEKANAALAVDVATVRNDVAWMRQRMEEERRRGAP